ncbi:MAG: glycosyl transferase group 1 [Gemmatimonadetes bacterium]|nr:glycosyl transferase group 1 [Gemmatimonadota bacterium]
MECDVDLRKTVPAHVRQHHEEPVPVVPEWNFQEQRPPARLHGISITHRDAEQPNRKPVVDAAHRLLGICAHLPAGHDIPSLIKQVEESRNVIRCILQIGVEQYHEAPRGGLHATQDRFGLAKIAPMPNHGGRPGKLPRLGFRCLERTVGGSIVHEHELASKVVSLESERERTEERRDILAFIERRNDHGEISSCACLRGRAFVVCHPRTVSSRPTVPPVPPCLDLLVFNWLDREHPEAGGAETNLHEIFGRLARRGHRVTLVSSSWAGAAPDQELDGIAVHRRGNRWTYPVAARAWYRERHDRHFDVVVEDLNKIPMATPVWVRGPVVLMVHHLFGASAFAAANPLVATATVLLEHALLPLYASVPVVAVSDSSAVEARRRTRHRDAVRVIHNGIPESAPPQHDDVARADTPEFLYIGRLQPYKRVDLLLQAMARLTQEHVEARLIVAGRGSEERALRRHAERLGIAHRVEFRGFVPEEEKFALMSRAWANVITSAKEGWGMSILDAATYGTPSIASDSPGLRDAVRDGQTGILVPHGNVTELAGAMRRIALDAELARVLGARARAYAQTFTWARAADAFEALLLTAARP